MQLEISNEMWREVLYLYNLECGGGGGGEGQVGTRGSMVGRQGCIRRHNAQGEKRVGREACWASRETWGAGMVPKEECMEWQVRRHGGQA